MTRTDIIQAAITTVAGRSYLEIGVARGANFLRVRARRKVAVDPFMSVPFSWIVKRVVRNPSNLFNRYVRTTSDLFFAGLPATAMFDVIFIDGLHTYEQSLRDANNAMRHLSPGGVVLLHDCNPPESDSATAKPPAPGTSKIPWCGEVWKTIVNLRATCHNRTVRVVDCDLGVGMVLPGPQREPLTFDPATLPSLTYADLVANRDRLLGLVQPDQMAGLLRTAATRKRHA